MSYILKKIDEFHDRVCDLESKIMTMLDEYSRVIFLKEDLEKRFEKKFDFDTVINFLKEEITTSMIEFSKYDKNPDLEVWSPEEDRLEVWGKFHSVFYDRKIGVYFKENDYGLTEAILRSYKVNLLKDEKKFPTCPSTDEIRKYSNKELPSSRTGYIAGHLLSCGKCVQKLRNKSWEYEHLTSVIDYINSLE